VRVAVSGGCGGGGPGEVLVGGTASVVAAAISAYDDDSGSVESASYTDGPAASNGGYTCGEWFGPLVEAEAKCTEDPSCRYLHDHNGDNSGWRVCSAVTFDDDGPAAVRMKPARYWGGVDGGANPNIRDVAVAEYTADNGGQCSMDVTATIGSRVDLSGACWQVCSSQRLHRATALVHSSTVVDALNARRFCLDLCGTVWLDQMYTDRCIIHPL
jgi:hypothetical protein